jgi:hypothetical protein
MGCTSYKPRGTAGKAAYGLWINEACARAGHEHVGAYSLRSLFRAHQKDLVIEHSAYVAVFVFQ